MFQNGIFRFRYIFVLIQLKHDSLPKGYTKYIVIESDISEQLTSTNKIFEKISIESRLYGSIVRASSQHVLANCNSEKV